MTITAKVVEDSISGAGARIVTLQLEYPRFIHAEFMTHRAFSKSASSSRAEPVAKRIANINLNPAQPIEWGVNKPGMQATEILTPEDAALAQVYWLSAKDAAVAWAEQLLKLNVHKQVVNRILEPFTHISVVCTATDWDNFFELRIHPDAQPEMRELAEKMYSAIYSHNPQELGVCEWHLPYVQPLERSGYTMDTCLQLSTARCARVSYLTHDNKTPEITADMNLYTRLVGSRPRHSSPCEHQATPNVDPEMYSRNFKGWIQHRELIEY